MKMLDISNDESHQKANFNSLIIKEVHLDKPKDEDNEEDIEEDDYLLSEQKTLKKNYSFLIHMKDSISLNNLQDSKQLTEMGFKQSIINKVYLYLNPNSIQQAIQYMTTEKGIYQHIFYESNKKSENVCFICGEEPQLHMDYRKRNLGEILLLPLNRSIKSTNENIKFNTIQGDNNNSNNNKDIIAYSEEQKCPICEEPFNESNYHTFQCEHKFCDDCLYEYIKEKIKNAKISSIQCPNCGISLNEDFIIQIVKKDNELIHKYKKFRLNLDIINDPNKKGCPFPNCESYAVKNDKDKYVKCQKGHKFCFNCLKEWHGKNKCDEQIDKDFLNWKKGKMVKNCPKCGYYTEKDSGCNHMTCSGCGYQWCWLCKGEYSDIHYEIGSGCAGLQFTDNEIFQNFLCIWMYKFAVFTGSLLLYWLLCFPLVTFRIILNFVIGLKLDDFSNCCISEDFILGLIYFPICLAYTITYYIMFFLLITLSLIPILIYHPLLGIVMDHWDDIDEFFDF